jgi:hypothetical protein
MHTIIKSQKFMWAAGIVLAVLFFGPSIISSARNSIARFQKPSPVIGQPPRGPNQTQNQGPAEAIAGSNQKPPSALPAPTALSDRIIGTWQNKELLDRGECTISLELRPEPNVQGAAKAYTKIACTPNPFKLAMKSIANIGNRTRPTPEQREQNTNDLITHNTSTAEEFAGKVTPDDLTLQETHFINQNEASLPCRTKTLKIRPFGADQLSLEWTEVETQSDCKGGQILLSRTGR